MSLLMAALKKAEERKGQLPLAANESGIPFITSKTRVFELPVNEKKATIPTQQHKAADILLSSHGQYNSSHSQSRSPSATGSKTNLSNKQYYDSYAINRLPQAKAPKGFLLKNYKRLLFATSLSIALPGTGISLWLTVQPKYEELLRQSTADRLVKTPLALPSPTPAPAPQEVRAAEALPATQEVNANFGGTLLATEAEGKYGQGRQSPNLKKTKSAGTMENQAPRMPLSDGEIHVTTNRPRLDPALEQGYSAFQKGELAVAQSAYEAAIKNDPNNIDALNGLALSHLRSGHYDRAQPLLQRSLEIDHRNGFTLAALAGLESHDDTVQTESRLKTAVADQPEAPYVYFSLGNYYARQHRWGDAQYSYFQAMARDPENPDYLFNLAVSLDRLQQTKLARQYYGRALLAAEKQPAAFSPRAATDRLRDLQP